MRKEKTKEKAKEKVKSYLKKSAIKTKPHVMPPHIQVKQRS